MEVSIVISGIALAVSVLSPFFTAMLNNRFRLKIMRKQFYHKHRAEVIEGYLSSAGQIIYSGSPESLSAFGKFSHEIFLYADPKMWSDIEKLNTILSPPYQDIHANKPLSVVYVPQALQLLRKITKAFAASGVRSGV